MAMELLGKSLQNLMASSCGSFRLPTVLLLADQILQILDFIHSQFVVHRDIKPANFVLGTGANCDKVFLIDFGLSNCCKVFDIKTARFKHIVNNRFV